MHNDDQTIRPDNAELFRSLRQLKARCGRSNKQDKVTVLICACLDAGVIHGKSLVRVISHLDFDQRFVGIVLSQNIGKLWTRMQDGQYALIAGAEDWLQKS